MHKHTSLVCDASGLLTDEIDADGPTHLYQSSLLPPSIYLSLEQVISQYGAFTRPPQVARYLFYGCDMQLGN